MLSLVDGDESTIVLVGLPMFPDDQDTPASCAVLLSPDRYYEVPSEMSDFLQFMATPRTRSELEHWLNSHDSPDDTVDLLVESGKVLLITPGPTSSVLAQFAGVTLRPEAIRLDWPEDEPQVQGVVFIGRPSRPESALPISSTLAGIMWDGREGDDLLAAMTRVATARGEDLDEVATEALEWLPGLLASGYAYLSPVGA